MRLAGTWIVRSLPTGLDLGQDRIGICTSCVAQYQTHHPFELVLHQVRPRVFRKHRGAVSVGKNKHDRFRIVLASLCPAATLHLILPNPLARHLSTAS